MMLPPQQTLSMIAGDRRRFVFNFTSPDGSIANLGGAVLWFTIKNQQSDPDSAAVLQIASDGSVGASLGAWTVLSSMSAALVLLPTATTSLAPKKYHYDAQATYSAADISTAVWGSFVLAHQITRS